MKKIDHCPAGTADCDHHYGLAIVVKILSDASTPLSMTSERLKQKRGSEYENFGGNLWKEKIFIVRKPP